MSIQIELDRFSVGIPAIGLVVLFAVLIQYLLKSVLNKKTIEQCHEVGGYYLTMVGTFYAVLVGLIVFDAISKFQAAEQAVDREGRAVIAIDTLSTRFPQQQKAIRSELTNYVDEVLGSEWGTYKATETAKARVLLLGLIRTILAIEPQTENQKALYPTLTSEMVNLWESRRERVRGTNFGLPVAEWVVLIAGATITILFTFFFTIESNAIQLLMTGMMTLMVSMSLYLILLFGYPFSGDLRVSNGSLLLAQQLVHAFP